MDYTCIKCLKKKDRTQFPPRKSSSNGIRNTCRECINIYNRAYFKNTYVPKPRKRKQPSLLTCSICSTSFEALRKRKTCSKDCLHKLIALKHKEKRDLRTIYGKSIEYIEEYRKTHPVCEICGNPETCLANKNGTRQKLALDHDHQTGQFRGVLCFVCNTRYEWYIENREAILGYYSR